MMDMDELQDTGLKAARAALEKLINWEALLPMICEKRAVQNLTKV